MPVEGSTTMPDLPTTGEEDLPLSADMKRVMAKLAELARDMPDRYELPFPAARSALEELRRFWNADAPDPAIVRDVTVEAGGHRMPGRVYAADPAPWKAAILYLHGGGWCVGSTRSHDGILRRLTIEAGMPVVGIDYPLAPEAPYPAALDAVAAIVRDASVLGNVLGTGQIPFIIAGDSAGANLGLAAAMRMAPGAAQDILGLMLFYGSYDTILDTPSYRRFGSGRFGLSTAAMERYLRAYVPDPAQLADPGVAPLRGRFAGLPPCFVTAAGCDPLHDDSALLRDALDRAGVETAYTRVPGVIHGYLSYAPLLPEARATLRAAGGWARGRVAAASGKTAV